MPSLEDDLRVLIAGGAFAVDQEKRFAGQVAVAALDEIKRLRFEIEALKALLDGPPPDPPTDAQHATGRRAIEVIPSMKGSQS